MTVEFAVPDELELLAFFGTEPVERSVEDGCWCYQITDKRGVTLRLSYNLFEQSVQTAILVDGAPAAMVVHEGAQSMAIDDRTLTCRFSYSGASATLTLRVDNSINLEWSSLRLG